MDYFQFKKGDFYCEEVKVEYLARRYQTPLYIYSAKTIVEHFRKLKKAFHLIKPLICYSVKANSNLSILKMLVKEGSGLDIVSGGELYRAKKIKCPLKKVVYASVGKTSKEIEEAICNGILMFNVESPAELNRINLIAGKLARKVDVALRFNPDVSPKTHAYITTGKKENKFGIDRDTARDIFLNRNNYPNLNLSGLHIHIGSQITESAPFIKAIKIANNFISELKKKKITLKYLNIGGGLGIMYDKEKPQTPEEFAHKVLPLLKQHCLKIILEPGRFIVGNAGILVTKVIYLKEQAQKKFIIVDAAMNDLARPSLYGAYHKIISLKKLPNCKSAKQIAQKEADVVGPVCESGDFLGKNRKLDVGEGDYIAVLGAGAYGFAMSSNYNSRVRSAEVLVKKNKAFLVRKRETLNDLIKNEVIV